MQRSTVRTVVPQGKDRKHVKQIVDALRGHQQPHAAAIVQLARATGMRLRLRLRLREAILADLPRLQREAGQLGKINIQDGTKGSRSGPFAPRWIALNNEIRAALEFAREVSPVGSTNLLASDETYVGFIREVVRPNRDVLH